MDAILRARLRQWFAPPRSRDEQGENIELAVAALLAEMIRADYQSDAGERETAGQMLERHFDIDEAAAARLLAEGERAADRAVSLFEHTRALDVGLDPEEKFAVIEALWEIAFADGSLDGKEDYLVHKIGALLHLRHSDLMRLKESVRRRSGESQPQGSADDT
ncbi:MAG TPA: TerB family tellurite resistance protein [Gammaproteobacteria bacterium]|nr:TerB family tellurite resistance protein [Gammaproteobacteria bacterium]